MQEMHCSMSACVVIHVPREHDAVLTKPGNIVNFLCTSCAACWTNHDRVI